MKVSTLLLAFTLFTGLSACTKSDDSKPAVNNNSNGNTDTVKYYNSLLVMHEPGARQKLDGIAFYIGASTLDRVMQDDPPIDFVVDANAAFSLIADQAGELIEDNQAPIEIQTETIEFATTSDDVFVSKNGQSTITWKPAQNSTIIYFHEVNGISSQAAAKDLNSLIQSAKTLKFRKQ